MYLFFDTETTGLPSNWKAPVTDLNNWPRLVQLAYLVYDSKGNKIKEDDFIIKPEGFTIPTEVSQIHGITTEIALREGKSLSEVLNQFHLLICQAEFLVAHNMNFDEKIVGAEFLRLGMQNSIPAKKKICTMESSTNFCAINGPYGYKWPKLSELHYKLFKTSFEEAHNAMIDIRVTSKCFWELVKRNIIDIPDHTDEIIDDIFSLIDKGKKEVGIDPISLEDCPKCKEKVAVDDVYCNNCGTKIRTSKIDTSSDENLESISIGSPLFSSDYDTLMKLANESLSVANYYEALEYFNKALNSCVNLKIFHLCSLYNGIGQSYFGLGKYNEAKSFLNKSIEIFPDFSAPYENLAATYFEMGKYDEFFETCELISCNFPISAKVWYYLAHAHENRGRYNIARVAYQNAIDNGMTECVVELSNLFKKMKNHENL